MSDDAKIKNEMLANGFGEAIGYCQPGIGIGGGNNFPGFNGVGTAPEQVSDAATSYENLRWYLISNQRNLISQLFVEIGLVQTVVCVPVDDALRGGVMFKSKQLEEEQLSELRIAMDRDDDINTAGWAAKWTRAFGGGGILILVDDQDPETELDLDSITEDSEITFRAVDMWELYWDTQNVEGYDPQVQEHDFEFYNYYSEQIHKSRVLRLKGKEAPSFIRPRLRGWGISEVETLIRSMNQYLKATDLGFEVLDEFKLDVYKIKNLVNTLLTPSGTQTIKERVQMANWQKNYQNAVVMDSEDDFDHKQLSFSGLAEAMAGIRMQVASDMRIPIVKLFGQSVSPGLGSSSPEEMENYNSMVEGEVRNKLKWHLLKMAEIKCQQLFGMIPDDLELEFKPLKELGAIDQETVREKKFARLEAAAARGAVSDKEYKEACNKGQLFDIQLDPNVEMIEQETDLEDDEDGEDGAEDSKDVPETEPEADKEYSRDVVDTETMPSKTPPIKNYTTLERTIRVFNSAEYDEASYEADGGDSWMLEERTALFDVTRAKDESLWKKCSREASGLDRDKRFTIWLYKKLGGKFT